MNEVKIKLLKPHTHAGQDYPTGDVIEVNSSDAAFLIAHKIGEADSKTTSTNKGE